MHGGQVTIIGGICRNPFDSELTTEELRVLANILGPRPPLLRTGGSLAKLFPTATTTNFDALDTLIERALSTGWRILLGPVDVPAWASGGKAACVCSVEGSSCQVLAQWHVPEERWLACYAAMLAANPDSTSDLDAQSRIVNVLLGAEGLLVAPYGIAWHFVDNYRRELTSALAWDNPEAPDGHVHVWGDPRFVEQDKLSAPRPWLLSAAAMPHIDPKAMQYMGEALADRYADSVDFFGVGLNEPDIALSNPLIAFDGVNGGDGGDTIRDRTLAEHVVPFTTGLRNILKQAPLLRVPRFIGPEVAYPGTLPRFSPIFDRVDVTGVHTYGSVEESSYAHAAQYAAQAKAARLPWGVSEFDSPDMTGWLRGLLALNLDPAPLFFIGNEGYRFVDGFGQGETKATADGEAMRALLLEVNGKRRVVRS